MTPQHPAAPETETDANGLRELLAAATPGLWRQEFYRDGELLPDGTGSMDDYETPGRGVYVIDEASAEGYCLTEFDAAKAADAALIVAAVNALPALLADLDAARERVRVVEGERDAAREQGTRLADGLYRWRDDAERYLARAESAEAAHEAEKAAHGKVWSLLGEYFDFDADPWQDHDAACPAPEDLWRLHRDLRALGGGGAR